MSIEQAQAFMEKVKNDEDLAKRLNEAEDSESRLNIAQELGYEFTLEEAQQVISELPDSALDKFAGGNRSTYDFCCDSQCGYSDYIQH